MSDAMSDKNEIMENEQKNEDSLASLQDADAVSSSTVMIGLIIFFMAIDFFCFFYSY